MRVVGPNGAGKSTLLLVEQSTHRALENADRICVLRQGRVDLEGRRRVLDEKVVEQAYCGDARGG